jgi:hypothetical protein
MAKSAGKQRSHGTSLLKVRGERKPMTKRTLPKRKRFYIVSVALGWGISMSIFSCAVFWKLGALTIISALALILVSTVSGFVFAVLWYEMMKRMVGPARDDNYSGVNAGRRNAGLRGVAQRSAQDSGRSAAYEQESGPGVYLIP